MPSPEALEFKPIPLPQRLRLPTFPPLRLAFIPTEWLTAERFNLLIDMIPEGFLTSTEIDLLAYVVQESKDAFAFTFAEKGTFSQKFYPDYEVPTIEHVPWQQLPVRAPKALEKM